MRILASVASVLLLSSIAVWSSAAGSTQTPTKTTPDVSETGRPTSGEAATVLTLPNGDKRVALAADQFAELSLANGTRLHLTRDGQDMAIHLLQNADRVELYRGFADFPPSNTAHVWLADVNFDGQQDLLVQTSVGYAGVNVYFDVLFSDETGFANAGPDFDLTNLSNPEIDPDMRQIRVSERSGPTWHNSVYEVENGQVFLEHTMTLAGEGLEYVRFYQPDGGLAREMITGALADNPRDWTPLTVDLPEGALFPLRQTPEADSVAIEPFPAGTTVILRRLNQDGTYLLLEHGRTGDQGWIKTEWLPLPDGFVLY